MILCIGETPTNEQLFEALGGTPDMDGTWTNNANTFIYTVEAKSPCKLNSVSRVEVSYYEIPKIEVNDKVICEGDLIDLNDLVVIEGINTSVYFKENQIDDFRDKLKSSIVSPLEDTTYQLVVEYNSCQVTEEIHISVIKKPSLNIEENRLLCSGNTDGIILDPYDINGDYNYTWRDQLGNELAYTKDLNVFDSGVYELEVSDVNAQNCNVLYKRVYVKESSVAKLRSLEIDDDSDNKKIFVQVDGLGDYEYRLQSRTGVDEYIQNNGIFENLATGVYDLTIIDKNGCSTLVINDLVLTHINRFFSPDGDGTNDVWGVEMDQSALHIKFIEIHDRFGKVIKTIRPGVNFDLTNVWDGTFKGFYYQKVIIGII